MMLCLGWIQLLMIATARGQSSNWRQQQLQSVHQEFSTPDPLILVRLVVVLLAVVAIFGIVKILAFVQQRQLETAKAQPYGLFMRVQAQLGVSLLDRWRLWRMAHFLRLADPAALLISPAAFDRAVEEYKPGPGGRIRLNLIREKLFGKQPIGC